MRRLHHRHLPGVHQAVPAVAQGGAFPRHALQTLAQAEAEDTDANAGEFKAEFLVVGKRNPSMPACQMLCLWLEKCLSTSTHDNPCGIMNTPCQCWETPQRKPGSCFRGGVYVEKCIPVTKEVARNAEILSK